MKPFRRTMAVRLAVPAFNLSYWKHEALKVRERDEARRLKMRRAVSQDLEALAPPPLHVRTGLRKGLLDGAAVDAARV